MNLCLVDPPENTVYTSASILSCEGVSPSSVQHGSAFPNMHPSRIVGRPRFPCRTLPEKMGRFGHTRYILICMLVCGEALTPCYTYVTKESGARHESLGSREKSTPKEVATERQATTWTEETADKFHAPITAQGEPASNAQHDVRLPAQKMSAECVAGALEERNRPENAAVFVHRTEHRESPTSQKTSSVGQSKQRSSGAVQASTLHHFVKQTVQPPIHSPVPAFKPQNRLQLVRDNKHSEFAKALAAYARQLSKRALSAGQELIDLLKTAEEMPEDRGNLLLKLFRTWPDVKELVKQYESRKAQSQEQLVSSLLQYRARATDLAIRPRPRIYASRAIKAYLDIGDPIFRGVMTSFLSYVASAEFTRLQEFREFYLPMLQINLSASASMLRQVPTKRSRVCLEVIERRIMQLEYLGTVARAVQQKWERLVLPDADGVR